MKRKLAELCLIGCFALLTGCGTARTDTGYQPHPLKMSNAQIRGLYAPEFSPEAAEAKADKKVDIPIGPTAGGLGR